MLLREPRPDDVLNEPRRKRPLSSLEGPEGCKGVGRRFVEGEGDYGGSHHLEQGPHIGRRRAGGLHGCQRDLEVILPTIKAANGTHTGPGVGFQPLALDFHLKKRIKKVPAGSVRFLPGWVLCPEVAPPPSSSPRFKVSNYFQAK